MSVGCSEGVLIVYIWCLVIVWRVSGKSFEIFKRELESVLKVSVKFLESILTSWKVCAGVWSSSRNCGEAVWKASGRLVVHKILKLFKPQIKMGTILDPIIFGAKKIYQKILSDPKGNLKEILSMARLSPTYFCHFVLIIEKYE